MTDPFEIRGGPVNDRLTLLRLSGTLDATGASALDEHVRGILAGGRHLILNMEGISFLSSTGIGVLLALNEDYREHGLDLRVSTPSKAVVAPIELLCLDRFLQICGSDEEARAGLAA